MTQILLRFRAASYLGLLLVYSLTKYDRVWAAEPPAARKETSAQTSSRHERVAQRRKATHVICHRGASEFAHENTLEAYRATFELGADGNEIDIRTTKDGVLVCFHDDMLDHLLEAFGDVGDYTWDELQRFPFREPGRYAEQCRIPALAEVFELHRKYAGLMHLDIKRPGLDKAISKLLDEFDMWDHVAYCNLEHGGVILNDQRLSMCGYKGGLYLDHGEVFPDAIAAALAKPGAGLIVDDPRGAVLALGRRLGVVSQVPVSPQAAGRRAEKRPTGEAELLAVLGADDDWNQVAQSPDQQLESGRKILARARAADALGKLRDPSPAVFLALEERARRRSLHKQWEFHGLDGAMALRSLILLRAPPAAEAARFALWRDDAALEPVVDPRFKNPRAWTDFRVKMVAFPALAKCPGEPTEKLCRDYLSLDDEGARKLGPPLFEEAARALLTVSPKLETSRELLEHRLQVVRGRAILMCLQHSAEPWAREALAKHAWHALAYVDDSAVDFTVKLDVVKQELDPGFCWFHPRIAAVPGGGKAGCPLVLLTLQKHLVADDHYSGLYYMTSDDLGKTWTVPTLPKELDWQKGENNETIAVCDATPGWHPATKKVVVIGTRLRYSQSGAQLLDKPRSNDFAYAVFDPDSKAWTTWKTVDMPPGEGNRFHQVAPGCVQWLVKPDGTLLVPVYYQGPQGGPYSVTVVHATFDGTALKYLAHGDELHLSDVRGLAEPSLASFQGKYYLTLRNDLRGYVTVSDDGLRFAPIEPWKFDDGSELGSYNTQQHWVVHSGGLFLCYTRRGANNDHITRNRAPLFMARVDAASLRVIRKTEKELIPERGVMLGNFGAAAVDESESWVTDSEFITGGKANPRGANGSTFVARIQWSRPNRLSE